MAHCAYICSTLTHTHTFTHTHHKHVPASTHVHAQSSRLLNAPPKLVARAAANIGLVADRLLQLKLAFPTVGVLSATHMEVYISA
jgi:hypothetical protein